MYEDLNELVVYSAKKKINFLTNNKGKYFVAAILAGMYVGLSILLIYTIGGYTHNKVLMGASFGISLSLVMLLGAELFTGNNMVGFGGVLNKTITVKNMIMLWVMSYLGNLVGSILTATVYVLSHAGNEEIINYMIEIAHHKIEPTGTQLFFKAILCNILVCLAVISAYKLKEETARLIMIWWCLFAFITTGYEHSVANMTVITVAILSKGATLAGMGHNLFYVTLGNIVGGSFLGAMYYLLRKNNTNK